MCLDHARDCTALHPHKYKPFLVVYKGLEQVELNGGHVRVCTPTATIKSVDDYDGLIQFTANIHLSFFLSILDQSRLDSMGNS